jgi:hypothetical protein
MNTPIIYGCFNQLNRKTIKVHFIPILYLFIYYLQKSLTWIRSCLNISVHRTGHYALDWHQIFYPFSYNLFAYPNQSNQKLFSFPFLFLFCFIYIFIYIPTFYFIKIKFNLNYLLRLGPLSRPQFKASFRTLKKKYHLSFNNKKKDLLYYLLVYINY